MIPSFNSARALLAEGITGTAVLLDSVTGRPHSIFNIKIAAEMKSVEEQRRSYFTRRYPPSETIADQTIYGPPAGEAEDPVPAANGSDRGVDNDQI